MTTATPSTAPTSYQINITINIDTAGTPTVNTTVTTPHPTPTPTPTPVTPVVVPVLPPPVGVPSNIVAHVNGVATTGLLPSLVAGLKSGDLLALPAGKFYGTSLITVPSTISGAGMGKTILDGTDVAPTWTKACLVPNVKGIVISDLTFQNWSISDNNGGNACGVRDGGPGVGGTLANVELTSSQEGMLTSGGNWTLSGCKVHNNGNGNASGMGFTHELYFNNDPNNIVTIDRSTIACGALSCHALKSRACTTLVTNSSLTANYLNVGGSIAGSIVDIPDGGNFTAQNCTFVLPSGASNKLFLGYGMESAHNLATGSTVRLLNCVFEDGTATGGIIANGGAIPSATLDVTGSTYTGAIAPSTTGWGTVIGTITKA